MSSPSDKKCARYLLSKICAPGKVDQSSPKSLKTCHAPTPSNTDKFGHSLTIMCKISKNMPKFTKFREHVSIGQTPNHAKFCHPSTKSVRYWYLLSKICASEKVDQRSPKSLKTCYAPMAVVIPNFIADGQTVYEKIVTNFFTPFTILASQRDSLGQSSPVWAVMHSKAASTKTLNFVPFWQPPYEISSAKVRRFRWQHDWQTNKKNKQ